MSYVIDPPKRVELPVVGSDKLYPVRRIYCVGRNYAAHAVEMGHDPTREAPFFFMKAPENIVVDSSNGCTFSYPPKSSDVHYEIEMVVALASGGSNIKPADALAHIYGYAVGLDMTRRDLQGEMKKAGRPWEIGKAFDCSAPMSALIPATTTGIIDEGLIELRVNDEIRQTGNLNQMIWKVPDMIAYLSEYFELAAGDLIMTGTPSGVGPVQPGDKLTGKVAGVGELHCIVA